MGSITEGLFGGGGKSSSTQSSVSGFQALPGDIQNQYRGLLDQALNFSSQPELFQPIGLTPQELQVQSLIDPANFGQSVSNYMNPFRDFITNDINTAFGDEYSLGAQLANEAGAFGSTRYRDLQTDIERQRLDAIGSASANQFNTAANQLQTGIGNLADFGALQRAIDLAQKQAPLQALGFGLGAYQPLLGGSQSVSQQTQKGGSSGLFGGLSSAAAGLSGLDSILGGFGGFGGGSPTTYSNPYGQSDASSVFGGGGGSSDWLNTAANAAMMFFSDSRLKRNIKKIGQRIGLSLYEFEYLWSPQKVVGYMAEEVRDKYPCAVKTHPSGYLMVNYGVLNG